MALTGLKVVEFAGLAPVPFAGLILADNGATVTRIDRPTGAPPADVLCRGKRSISISPKIESGRALLKKLISQSDVLIDPFRPGVMERLGLGPDVFLGDNGLNKRLVYARIVGFTRTGPYKDMAGHDLNYLALSGALATMPGTSEKPSWPLNLVGDFAGGGMLCALGILIALLERGKSGKGQVVETEMVSGARYLSTWHLSQILLHLPYFNSPRGTNPLDGGGPYYAIYTCADGRWMSVGCIEPQFYKLFIERFVKEIGPEEDGWYPRLKDQNVKDLWARTRGYLERGFRTKPRDEWSAIYFGTDACVVPVLSPHEAALFDSPVPSPHPHLSRTPPNPSTGRIVLLHPGAHTREILGELGVGENERRQLMVDGAIRDDNDLQLQAKL